tara:strand:- start:38 stop:595 length:558 start_codon:yes stop_codon:yes gene_type:complete
LGVSESSIVLLPSANASPKICVQPQITTTHPDGSQDTRNVGQPVCTPGGVSFIPVEMGEAPGLVSSPSFPPTGGGSSNPGDTNYEPIVRTRADCEAVVDVVRQNCLLKFRQWNVKEISACPNHSYSGFVSIFGSGIIIGLDLGLSIEINSQAQCYEEVNSTTNVLLGSCMLDSAKRDVELCNGLP